MYDGDPDDEPICANCGDWQSDCCCDDPEFYDE